MYGCYRQMIHVSSVCLESVGFGSPEILGSSAFLPRTSESSLLTPHSSIGFCPAVMPCRVLLLAVTAASPRHLSSSSRARSAADSAPDRGRNVL